MNTCDETRDDVRLSALDDFRNHELSQLPCGDWRCGRRHSCISSFRVILRPGFVFVYGDVGDWILQHSDADSLAWLRGAVGSPDYLLGKVRAGKEDWFYEGDVVSFLEDQIKQDIAGAAEILDGVREAIDCGTFDRNAWYELLAERDWEREDACVGTGPAPSMFWLVEALKWFVTAHDAQQAAINAGAQP